MNNNGIIKYKENFITKIKKFFKKLFERKEEQYNYVQQEPVNEIAEEKNESQSDFIDNIKKQKALSFLFFLLLFSYSSSIITRYYFW